MEAISAILTLLLLVIGGFYLHALRKPNHKLYAAHLGKAQTRKSISKKFLPVLLIIFVLISITAPPSNADQQSLPNQTSQSSGQEKNQKTVPTPVIKEVSQTTAIPFEIETQEDPLLPLGQTSVAQEGENGEKVTVYEVTYLNGKEVNRTIKASSVTQKPVSKIVYKGTYVAPTYSAPSDSASGSGYTNIDGNHINSPSSNPAGATAQCSDGTYSYSQHHSGTCSHHGGVAIWL